MIHKTIEDRVDPNQPALIVLYGATKRKVRPLKSDIVVLGRANSSDIGLMSPDVAPVHCILIRLGNSWRIRDCSGRATRLNGKAIDEAELNNGDVIQVGTFSFEANLPSRSTTGDNSTLDLTSMLQRLQKSRRRLVQLALNYRQRLRDNEAQEAVREQALEHQQADLEEMERRLRQSYQEKQTQLTEEQKKLDARKEELDCYAQHLIRASRRLAEEAREQIEQIESEMQAIRVEQNREAQRLLAWQQDLFVRQQEIESTARRFEENMAAEQEQLNQTRLQIQREREYLAEEREEVVSMRQAVDLARSSQDSVADNGSSRDTQLDSGPTPAPRKPTTQRLIQEIAERKRLRQNL